MKNKNALYANNFLGILIPAEPGHSDMEIYCGPPGPQSQTRIITGHGTLRLKTSDFLNNWKESLEVMHAIHLLEVRDPGNDRLLVYIWGDYPGSTIIPKLAAEAALKEIAEHIK